MCDPSSNPNRPSETGLPRLLGLVPAAGSASRISPLPLSKELFPVGFHRPSVNSRPVPKPVCLNLLENMRRAGVTEAYIVLRSGKWDIPAYLGCGKALDMNLGYLIMDLPFGVPFTLDQAFPFTTGATIAFGFPDILFQPEDGFSQLLDEQTENRADVVLGLFPAQDPQKMDMVALDSLGNISGFEIKPGRTDLRYTWIIAVWNFRFTQFIHGYVLDHLNTLESQAGDGKPGSHREIHMSEVMQAAIASGLNVSKVIFDQGSCMDVGSPENLAAAIHMRTDPRRL